MSRGEKILVIIICTIVGIALAVVIALLAVRAAGRKNLQSVETAPTLITPEMTEAEPEENKWKEGWVRYNGHIYEYNDSLVTFLFMGIDKRAEEFTEAKGASNGGQADALFLIVLDRQKKETRIIAINRNTMVPVDVYDEAGKYVSTVTAQINTQHGFGNGLEESCEYQVKAVQNLMYNIPIHGYISLNMKAVETITDAVGGVDITVLEDVTESKTHELLFKKGDELHMDGADAYKYVTVRDTAQKGSANGRLEREKQYLNELIRVLKKKTAEDITTPVKLFGALSGQMVTNVTMSEVTYLASDVVDFSFDMQHIYSLEGDYIAAEDSEDSVFDEFYPDEEALQRLIIEVFYRPVE